ncbi:MULTISPECIES: hypothetical protein [unclassified Bacillus cereus group]|uniref:lipase family alpha/beta hydrolase n=1 Tax=unclassified Bacillus cereus group TaxID=2750818 RepID=UPI001F5990A5|nr:MULTISPECIES: hypothetical protein [unclassified Bacillus cereus group]
MKIMKRCIVLLIAFLFIFSMYNSKNVQANIGTINGKWFPTSEAFTPGDWFLGEKPFNYDENRPPIVFVQGRNGSADTWYGETVYHEMNDMYEYAFRAGYQTVFIQLYDAAGKGSATQWKNGQLLAEKLEEIYTYFGKKVNIVAHSKGGIDTQAALVQYGANRFVGNVIMLASPHYGSNLADLSYSWWAGWLASLLGQRDEGTYSLQIGEMAHFRSIIDQNPNSRLNGYYTATGTSWGPCFSALSIGGLYLSNYGSNDGLVNEWSTKLPYGIHLFTDSGLNHDNIRKGSAVFSRIEPYLRTSQVKVPSNFHSVSNEISNNTNPPSNQTILGGALPQHNWVNQPFVVDRKTEGTVSILTASSEVKIELLSPSGKIYTNKDSVTTIGEEESYFKGASIHTFQLSKMEEGEWNIKMLSNHQQDAYMMVVNYKQDDAPFTLKIPNKMKAGTAKYQLEKSAKAPEIQKDVSVTVRIINKEGTLVSASNDGKQINDNMVTGLLKNMTEPGVYNVTFDIKGLNKEGKVYTRTMIQSVYIEK